MVKENISLTIEKELLKYIDNEAITQHRSRSNMIELAIKELKTKKGKKENENESKHNTKPTTRIENEKRV